MTKKNNEEGIEEVPAKFKDLVKEIEKMSVLELNELIKVLEKKFGVSNQMAMITSMPVGGISTTTSVESSIPTAVDQKNIFDLILVQVGDKKIDVIKTVRDITQKGLKESKDLVDAVEKGPQLIKENVKKEETEEIKKKFEVVGAKVELK